MSHVAQSTNVEIVNAQQEVDSAFAPLLASIRSVRATVGVVGQGYVGFPLAQRSAACGFRTIGFDLDERALQRARSLNTWDRYVCTGDLELLGACSVVIVAVPTPTIDSGGEGHAPDLTAVRAAAEAIGRYRHAGGARLVAIESTYAPGTTRGVVAPLVSSVDALEPPTAIAYSPERIDPGNDRFDVVNIPKLVSGLDANALALATAFYEHIVDNVVVASAVEAAEAAKLLENVFRFINITFAQEFDEYCERLGIRSHEVVALSATKPFGFMPFRAGAGIGGHCIAEDPYFLRAAIYESGLVPPLLDAAIANHERRARVVAERVHRQLAAIEGARILVLGVTYKPDVADTRRSPASDLIRELESMGANVSFADPYISSFAGRDATDPQHVRPSDYDLAVVVTPHRAFDVDSLRAQGWTVFDLAHDLRAR